jgi:N-acetylmuramoyl-L-alanine amidase
MRCVLPVVVGLLSGTLTIASAPRASETIQLFGKEYARVSDWAKANELELRWIKRDETLELNNRALKVRLEVNSNEAEVNGVAVKLMFPVAYREGVAYLSQLDVLYSLHPVLHPPRNRPGSPIKTICLDPGHGGKEPGFRVGANEEKKYTLLLAQEVRDQLIRAGLKVISTRTADKFVDLEARPELAKRRNADLFVSLHFNSAPTSRESVRGAEVYCMTPAGAPSSNAQGEGANTGWLPGNRSNEKNMFLAYHIQRALTRELEVEDRGVHRARFAVLRDAVMPAVLIEAGFMSHPVEGRKIFDAAYRRQMARAITDGVLEYRRQVDSRGERAGLWLNNPLRRNV